MQQPTNRISQFWQELKRRKVVRVITVYAAAAFVILELLSIIIEPLRLPGWTLQFAIVFLCIGFIIAVILSWIYDIHPDGGVVKTEPVQKATTEAKPKSSSSWKVASYISFVVIVGLIVLNIIPRTNVSKEAEILDKSIAVLPLEYLSANPDNEYLANGVLDAITGHLSLIKGLRVMPRTSVEQYRENKKSAKEIGEELDVSYLIEGSFLMIENQVKLTIQLVVAAEGDHIFFREYDRNYSDIFTVQSEVAQTIAIEIEVAITPEEKQRIEKIPTTNLTSYDFYQRGRDEYQKYEVMNDMEALERVEDLYYKAIENDSTFAQAYTGLAQVYWDKQYIESYFSEDFMDSVLVLTDIALAHNDQLADAFILRGKYYNETGKPDQALKELDKAIKLNPNDWRSYQILGSLFYEKDVVKAFEYRHKAASLNRGPELSSLLKSLALLYNSYGFMEKAAFYYQEAFRLDGDSVNYYSSEFLKGTRSHLDNIEYYEILYALDTTNYYPLRQIGYLYMLLDQYEESLAYFTRWMEKGIFLDLQAMRTSSHRIGYVYWQNGYKEEADHYFDQQVDYCNRAIELGRSWQPYYDLAGVYAFRGEKGKAYENLRIYNRNEKSSRWIVELIDDDPLFDSISDEAEFQQIKAELETKYQAEHERVRQWLQENDML